MNFSFNISKIKPPDLPQILYRPRLINLLEKNKDKKLILILGQAAHGKSTLIASYVTTSKVLSAWLNLDKEDSNPVNLFYLIVQSLRHTLKDNNFSHLLSLPLEIMDPKSEIPLYCSWTKNNFEYISILIHLHSSSSRPSLKMRHPKFI